MKIHLFITAGTSALTNSHVGQQLGHGFVNALRQRIANYLAAPEHEPDVAQLRTQLIDAHRAYWKNLRPGIASDPKQTSAELFSSFALLGSLQHQPNPIEVEAITLLASDTSVGRLAAEINQHLLLHEPELNALHHCRTVDVAVVPNLDAQFQDLREPIIQCVQNRLTNGQQPLLNVTGGFKGTVITVAAVASEFRWQLYYQHETLSSSIWFTFEPVNGQTRMQAWDYPHFG